ncbi:MAG: hypothetical protein NTV12_03115 [Verrucomicrobia bacterium]|nr:hypothetical protein [Verrucomicrobiota bacterium]
MISRKNVCKLLKNLFPMYLHITLNPISLFAETVKDRAGTLLDDQSNMKKNDR